MLAKNLIVTPFRCLCLSICLILLWIPVATGAPQGSGNDQGQLDLGGFPSARRSNGFQPVIP